MHRNEHYKSPFSNPYENAIIPCFFFRDDSQLVEPGRRTRHCGEEAAVSLLIPIQMSMAE